MNPFKLPTILNISPPKIKGFTPISPKMKDLPKRITRGKSFKQKGDDFQNRVKKYLIKNKYKVSKAHNIHYDWHAIKGKKTYYVEAKCTTARLSHQQVTLRDKVLKQGNIYLLAEKTKTGRIKLNFKRK